jgi:hypothetical protein
MRTAPRANPEKTQGKALAWLREGVSEMGVGGAPSHFQRRTPPSAEAMRPIPQISVSADQNDFDSNVYKRISLNNVS